MNLQLVELWAILADLNRNKLLCFLDSDEIGNLAAQPGKTMFTLKKYLFFRSNNGINIAHI